MTVATGLGKLAFLPGAVRDVARSHVIAGAYKKPPPTPIDDAKQVGERFMPISLQQFVQQGFSMEAWSGAVGFLVYGKSEKLKADEKRGKAT